MFGNTGSSVIQKNIFSKPFFSIVTRSSITYLSMHLGMCLGTGSLSVKLFDQTTKATTGCKVLFKMILHSRWYMSRAGVLTWKFEFCIKCFRMLQTKDFLLHALLNQITLQNLFQSLDVQKLFHISKRSGSNYTWAVSNITVDEHFTKADFPKTTIRIYYSKEKGTFLI